MGDSPTGGITTHQKHHVRRGVAVCFTMKILWIFENKKVLFLKIHFFYSIDVYENGKSRNIVTTSVFMTLVYTTSTFLIYLIQGEILI